jgi:hypothetical protein
MGLTQTELQVCLYLYPSDVSISSLNASIYSGEFEPFHMHLHMQTIARHRGCQKYEYA